jgi:hypothetical protein
MTPHEFSSIIERAQMLSRKASVSFTIERSEAEDCWEFSIGSAAPSECWRGRSETFGIGMIALMKKLDALATNYIGEIQEVT